MSLMSIQSLTNSSSNKRPCSDDQPSAKRQRLGESENSENRMGQRDASLVDAIYTLSRDAICTLSRHILQSNLSDISYVEKVLAKLSSVDPRIRSLLSSVDLRIGSPRNRIQQEKARIKAKQLYHTAVSLQNHALSHHAKKALRKNLTKAQTKLEGALVIEPRNAATLAFLGVVLKNHALFLPGERARLQKLKEAQTKLQASLEIEPRNAATLASLRGVLELQAERPFGQATDPYIYIDHSKLEILIEAQAKKLIEALNEAQAKKLIEAQAEYTQAKRQRLGESGNSESGMGRRDTSLVDAICTLSRHILQSNQSDISYVKRILTKLSSVDPRIWSFLSSVDPRIGSLRNRIKARQLYHTGVSLHNHALVLDGKKARRTKFMEAQKKLKDALVIEPRNAATLAFLGVVLKNHALGLFDKGARPHPGKQDLQLEQLDAAQTKLQASLEIEPRNAATLASLGGVLELQAGLLFSQMTEHYTNRTAEYKLEKLNAAQAKYKAALVISPRKPDIVSSLRDVILEHALFLRRESYNLSGPSKLEKLKEAQTKFQAALDIAPRSSGTLFHLGYVLELQAELLSGNARLQKLKEAQTKFQVALKREPRCTDTLFHLGYVLKLQALSLSGEARSTKLNKAQTKLEDALKIFPRLANALFHLGGVLKLQSEFLSGKARLQKLKEAQAKFKAGLVIKPFDAFALTILEEIAQSIKSSD